MNQHIHIHVLVAKRLIADVNVKQEQKESIITTLDNHIEAMMYNIASISAVTALAQDKNKIEGKHIGFVRTYIGHECSGSGSGSSQSGGAGMPSEFYGYSTGAYSEANAGGINMSDARFGVGGYIRPALDMNMTGGGHSSSLVRENASAKRFIKSVLKFNGVGISKTAFSELMLMIDHHISCLKNDIKKQEPLSISKLEKVLARKRHAVFK